MSFFKRVFRPLGQGSVRGSVFTLFSGSVGAGVLSLPQVMSYYGLTVGVLMILFNSFLAYTSYTSLFKAIMISGKKRYPNLVNYYLGRGPARLFALSIICVQFLSVCIFSCIGKFSRHFFFKAIFYKAFFLLTKIAWNFIQHLIVDFKLLDLPMVQEGPNKVVDNYAPYTFAVRAIILTILMVLMEPLALLKKLSALRYFSLGNLFVLFYIIATTVGQSPLFYKKFKDNPDYKMEWTMKPPSMNWLSGFSTIILSYMCHPNFFYVRTELVKPSRPRVKKVIFYAITIETVVYLSMAIAGYISLGDTYMVSLYALRPKLSKQNTLNNFPPLRIFH
jgi:amino acid permease